MTTREEFEWRMVSDDLKPIAPSLEDLMKFIPRTQSWDPVFDEIGERIVGFAGPIDPTLILEVFNSIKRGFIPGEEYSITLKLKPDSKFTIENPRIIARYFSKELEKTFREVELVYLQKNNRDFKYQAKKIGKEVESLLDPWRRREGK